MARPEKDGVAINCLSNPNLAPAMARNMFSLFHFWIEMYAGGQFLRGENLTGVVPSSLLSEEELEKPWTGALNCRKPFDFLKENSYSDAAVYIINVEFG